MLRKLALVALIAVIAGAAFLYGQATTTLNQLNLDWSGNNGNLAIITLTGSKGGQTRTITLNLINSTCTATATTFCGGAASSSLTPQQVTQLQAMFPDALKKQFGQSILNVIQTDTVN